MSKLIPLSPLGVTVAAINGTVTAGFKRHLGGGAASGTNGFMHFARFARTVAATDVSLFPLSPALGTTARVIGKSFFRIKLLFGSGKHKLGVAVATN